jgi:hypothetical protein
MLSLVCSLAASTIILAPNTNAPYRSIAWYDQQVQNVSQQVLDRSICPKIMEVWKETSPAGTKYTPEVVEMNRRLIQQAVAQHCQKRFLQDGLGGGSTECGSGFLRD